MKLLTTSEYIADASKAIARSKKRVIVMTLCISKERETAQFIDSLIVASKNGVDVSVAADTFTFSEFGGYFNPFKRWAKYSREAKTIQNAEKMVLAFAGWVAITSLIRLPASRTLNGQSG